MPACLAKRTGQPDRTGGRSKQANCPEFEPGFNPKCAGVLSIARARGCSPWPGPQGCLVLVDFGNAAFRQGLWPRDPTLESQKAKTTCKGARGSGPSAASSSLRDLCPPAAGPAESPCQVGHPRASRRGRKTLALGAIRERASLNPGSNSWTLAISTCCLPVGARRGWGRRDALSGWILEAVTQLFSQIWHGKQFSGCDGGSCNSFFNKSCI